MNYLIIISIVFLLYELYKVIFMKRYWSFVCSDANNKLFNFGEVLYALFVLSLLFQSKYWYFAVLITLISFVGAHKISEHTVEKKFVSDSGIKRFLITDAVVTIAIFLYIITTQMLK